MHLKDKTKIIAASHRKAVKDIAIYAAYAKGWAEPASDPPNVTAIEIAHRILSILKRRKIGIHRISPDVEGGLVIHLNGLMPYRHRWCGFYVGNDGLTCFYTWTMTPDETHKKHYEDCETDDATLAQVVEQLFVFLTREQDD